LDIHQDKIGTLLRYCRERLLIVLDLGDLVGGGQHIADDLRRLPR
jgi:hypothetical protein